MKGRDDMAYYPPSVGGYQPPQMQMMPQAPSYPPMNQNATTGQQGFTVRPVASREEAMAVQTDFFGLGTILPCLGQGVIWLKRFNTSTGSSDLLEFRIVQPFQVKQTTSGKIDPVDFLRQLLRKVDELEQGVVINVPDEQSSDDVGPSHE